MELQVIEMDAQSLQVRAQKKDLLSAEELDQIKDFTQELDQALREIGEATKKSQELNSSVQDLRHTLDNRSFWGSLKAGFSGKTDKELALMVESLGAGLSVTQNVVRVILKVMTQKNRVLHGFNKALVDKITAVAKDSVTLDHNQRFVAQEFLSGLQRQVAEQIRQVEMVDEHEMKLIEFDGWREEKNEQNDRLDRNLTGLEEAVAAFRQEMDGQRQEVSRSLSGLEADLASQDDRLRDQRRWMDAKDSADGLVTSRIDCLEARSDALAAVDAQQESWLAGQAEQLKVQAAELGMLQASERDLQQQVEALRQRVAKLEDLEGQSHSAKARLLRYGPTIIVGGIAAAGLYQALI